MPRSAFFTLFSRVMISFQLLLTPSNSADSRGNCFLMSSPRKMFCQQAGTICEKRSGVSPSTRKINTCVKKPGDIGSTCTWRNGRQSNYNCEDTGFTCVKRLGETSTTSGNNLGEMFCPQAILCARDWKRCAVQMQACVKRQKEKFCPQAVLSEKIGRYVEYTGDSCVKRWEEM